MVAMATLETIVRDGRALLEHLEQFPDGTKLKLVVVAEGNEMEADELAALDESLERAVADEKAGRVEPASALIARMRASR